MNAPKTPKPLFLNEVEVLVAVGAVSNAEPKPKCYSLRLSNGEVADSACVEHGRETLLEKLMQAEEEIRRNCDLEKRQRGLFDGMLPRHDERLMVEIRKKFRLCSAHQDGLGWDACSDFHDEKKWGKCEVEKARKYALKKQAKEKK